MLLRMDRMDEDDQLANEARRLVISYLHSDTVDASSGCCCCGDLVAARIEKEHL